MSDDSQKIDSDEDLSSVLGRMERTAARWLLENAAESQALLVLAIVVIASPLIVFWLDSAGGKEWSETVKNVVESAAVMAAVFAAVKWVNERRDRATDVLLSLEKEFKDDEIIAGRKMIEDSDCGNAEERNGILDAMLRFYVVLYGVYVARQVPEKSLSICFRYWLAHYFRRDREVFRAYVDRSYPTLKGWLRNDCTRNCRFFNPAPLFHEQTDMDFIANCSKETKS